MKETIRFRGLSLAGDEIGAQHGELSMCAGVELHDGALRPSLVIGSTLADDAELTGTLVYVHITTSFTRYICFANGGLYWSGESLDDNGNKIWKNNVEINGLNYLSLDTLSINSIGNTLCVLAPNGLHYVYLKDTEYRYMGQKPPFLELQFNMAQQTGKDKVDVDIEVAGQEGGIISLEGDGGSWIQYDQTQIGTGGWNIREGYRTIITEQVMAAANKLISEATEEGLFHSPFLIRYCYRLFDGTSMIFHSAPVLMMPAKSNEIVAGVKEFYRGAIANNQYHNFDDKFTCNITILTAKLQMRCMNPQVIESLAAWSDIIKSVDIFITPQITRINTADQIKFIKNSFDRKLGEGLLDGAYNSYYAAEIKRTADGFTYQQGGLEIPMCTEAEFKEKIKTASTFFKLVSFKTEDLSNRVSSTFSDIPIENNIASNIVVQTQMKDDYKSHNQLIPIADEKYGLYTYNHRLNVYGIAERLFEGFSPDILFPWMNSTEKINKVIVTLNTDNGLKRVEKICNTPYIPDAIKGYAFYPDARANSIAFVYGETEDDSRKFKLSEHMSLNGAFYAYDIISYFPLDNGNDLVPMPSKIYTSEMDNPYYFPADVINTVGTGTIIGLAAVTRALSAGQVGDHDLVVFSTDGIWVMKVSAEGSYSDKHNISREVCSNPGSITQLDQSVIFATKRGLYKFVESDVACISDILDGVPFDIQNLMPAVYDDVKVNGNTKVLAESNTKFADIIADAKIIYDYTGSRLLIVPKNMNPAGATYIVAYIFSIHDGTWSTVALSTMRSFINGYPYPYMQYANGKLRLLDKPYSDFYSRRGEYGFIVTRILSYSDTMDLIRGYRQMHNSTFNQKIYFYGSNDQKSWIYIGNSAKDFHNYLPGHPYRFFRIALSLTLKPSEYYQQMELEIINKYAKL